jgi:hypothetical protein
MKKQIILLFLVLVLMVGSLSGCNQKSPSYTAEKNKFVGTWTYVYPSGEGTNYSFIYHFFSNGTFSFNKTGLTTNGTFDITDGELILATNVSGVKQYVNCSYMFSENNTMLTIDGTPYTKTIGKPRDLLQD